MRGTLLLKIKAFPFLEGVLQLTQGKPQYFSVIVCLEGFRAIKVLSFIIM